MNKSINFSEEKKYITDPKTLNCNLYIKLFLYTVNIMYNKN